MSDGVRIAFIAPRYGQSIVGGAETLCRLLAENLTAHGTRVDVLTTCAVDHFTWADALPPGESREGGVRVRRFAVGPRDPEAFAVRHAAIDRGVSLTYAEQVAWMADSVWSPGILAAIPEYDWVVAMPYLFGTSFWATVTDPDRTVLIPCLHDENHARQAVVLDSLCSVKGLMMNAPGEQRLLASMLQRHRGGRMEPRNRPVIVGGGFDDEPIPDPQRVSAFCTRFGIDPGYLLYAGRRELAKGVGDMYEYYRLYRDQVERPRPLALMGSGDTQPPPDIAPHVVDLGFVATEERPLAYAGASLLIQPSRLESFGMVVFESWLAGTPVLVNADSDVLREHCRQSGGGLWFDDGPSFAEALGMLDDEPGLVGEMADAGRRYTLAEFRWEAVRRRFVAALEEWA